MTLRWGYKKVIVFTTFLLTVVLFLMPSAWLEIVYGRWLYWIVRAVFQIFNQIPFPLFYLFVIGLISWGIWGLKQKISWQLKLKRVAFSLGLIFCCFYLLWAFNYRRLSFQSRYPVEFVTMDSMDWSGELSMAYAELLTLRPALIHQYKTADIERLIADSIQQICTILGYRYPFQVRVKALYPKGILLRLKTAGFYLPYAGEGYIDAGLHPIQMAYTLAHEMAHGYGVTDEGACNLIAYIACRDHRDSTISYSARMAYYRYVAGEVRYRYPTDYQLFRSRMDPGIKSDLDAVNAQMARYPDILPRWRDMIYDRYLTLQGIPEGMASYDKIIGYVRAYRRQGNWNFN
jgi:hypothetical protein